MSAEKERQAPLAAAMEAYAAGGALAFHTPGHKQGLGAHPLLSDLITAKGLCREVSLMDELDDPYEPTGCIREAESLAASLFGADAAYFMVNGTSGAIHTMLMATLSPGDEVLVPRNVHRSVWNGLVMAGAVPVYITPARDEALGIAMGLTTEAVHEALLMHPSAKAILVVYPTYYGVTFDLASIVSLAHAHDLVVLVDEAHGAHLRFSAELPPDALSCGADLVAQSTHKLLGSLTQTSMLFRRGTRVSDAAVRRAQALVGSTSPNYLLLASLDIARLQMEEEGEMRMARAVQLANGVRKVVNNTPGLWCFGADYMGKPGATGLDVTKLTVQTAWLGHTGADAVAILRREYHLQAELADAYNVLFLLTMADTEPVAMELARRLQDFALRHRTTPIPRFRAVLPETPAMKMTPREAYFAAAGNRAETVPMAHAAGRVAAEQVTFYPPGIPVVCAGEQLTTALLDAVQVLKASGLRVTGAADPTLATLRVF